MAGNMLGEAASSRCDLSLGLDTKIENAHGVDVGGASVGDGSAPECLLRQ
jgi:hypothetical protein